jgi:leader peptidase (prepilin peptidase) / N-methyltransferase
MIIFFIFMLILCYTDMKHLTISNWVVLPAIIIGVAMTGYWLTALIMGWIGIWLYKRERICGGDVKLLAMLGAFLSWKAFFVFALSRGLVYLYRKIKNYNGLLPYTPFVAGACVLLLWIK